MDFTTAENAYRDLKQQHDDGKLTDEEFEVEVANLEVQDAEGNWWQLGVETGEWYVHDGAKWKKDTPPLPGPAGLRPIPPGSSVPTVEPSAAKLAPPAAAPSGEPTAPAPEKPIAAPPPPPAQPAASTAPPPAAPSPAKPIAATTPPPAAPPPAKPIAATTPPFSGPPPLAESGVTAGGSASQKNARIGVAAPPATGLGSAKSLPTRWLIALIAAVALVPILICVGGYLAIGGVLKSNVRPTTTSTASLASLASSLSPTVTEIPTDTPEPTLVVTATATNPAPPVARRTATPTPTVPVGTATPSIPPGVYVTNIETVPPKVNIGDTIGFKVSFLNTTGIVQTFNWQVKVYQCPVECQDFKHSHGETNIMNTNVATGTSDVATTTNVGVKAGISCDLTAVATYLDPVTQMPTPFQSTKNGGQFSFSPCH